MTKRLLLVDDHALMLEGLTRLLSEEFEIVGTATNEAARRLGKLLPAVKIVFVTQQLAPEYLHAAFAAGAKAYVAKQSAASELVNAIRMALADRYYVTPLAGTEAARLSTLNPRENPSEFFGTKLTPRQREVLQLVAEGKSTKEISSALNISPKTVEFHRNSLMDELGVRTIAELTRYALSQGIVNQ
jgi:DNA-binding NarL/FixJ family response regulator